MKHLIQIIGMVASLGGGFVKTSRARNLPQATELPQATDWPRATVLPQATDLPQPPVPPKKFKRLSKFGDLRVDPYYWMRERDNPAVKAHLEKENDYYSRVMAPTEALQTEVVNELRSRMNEADESYPYRDGPYFYYHRFEAGLEYPIYARRRGLRTAPEEILLDVNARARRDSSKYYSSSIADVSADHHWIVVATDNVGRRFYDLEVLDLEHGHRLLAKIPQTAGDAVLSRNKKFLFFTRQDPETLRAYQVFRYDFEKNTSEVIFEEKDETYNVAIGEFLTERYVYIRTGAAQQNETWLIDGEHPEAAPRLFLARRKGHLYSVEDGGDRFFILTNWKAPNFKLMECLPDRCDLKSWTSVLPHRASVYLEDVDVFRQHVVVTARRQGLLGLSVLSRKDGSQHELKFPDSVYVLSPYANAEYDPPDYLYSYESPTQPPSVFRFDFGPKTSELVKSKKIPNFDSSRYDCERLLIRARDGERVPVSLIFKKGSPPNGQSPLVLTGYGSYGFSTDPNFSTYALAYVDRGFVFALAHVRGGSELGRRWYDEGRMKKKLNTFYDFIDVTEGLVKKGWARSGHVYAEGGSAGGLLMGAIANFRPDLYRGITADVPFVDVLTTMLDDTIPLTTGEYEEWGNPNVKADYRYIKKYSPYDNVGKKSYPHFLITSGWHDSQVQYWEPAKWAAKIREHKVGDSLVLLHTEMSAGHSGVSGRFEALKEAARTIAFFVGLERGLLKTSR